MSGSLLDMLRQRTAATMENEALRRASDFGAGMLASGSPNFFTMLGAGARAQAEGERSRMDELRRLAEAERQQRMADIEEQRRRDEAAYRQQRLEAEAPERAARTEQSRALAEYYRQGGARRPATTGITVAQRLQAERDAAARARIAHPDLPTVPAPTAAQQAELQRLRDAYIARELPRLLEAAANPSQIPAAPNVTAPPAPAAVINARGVTVNPPR